MKDFYADDPLTPSNNIPSNQLLNTIGGIINHSYSISSSSIQTDNENNHFKQNNVFNTSSVGLNHNDQLIGKQSKTSDNNALSSLNQNQSGINLINPASTTNLITSTLLSSSKYLPNIQTKTNLD